MADQYVQCTLECGDSRMVVLLPDQNGVKVGNFVTLKDSENPELKWKITSVGQPLNFAHIHRTWNNNI